MHTHTHTHTRTINYYKQHWRIPGLMYFDIIGSRVLCIATKLNGIDKQKTQYNKIKKLLGKFKGSWTSVRLYGWLLASEEVIDGWVGIGDVAVVSTFEIRCWSWEWMCLWLFLRWTLKFEVFPFFASTFLLQILQYTNLSFTAAFPFKSFFNPKYFHKSLFVPGLGRNSSSLAEFSSWSCRSMLVRSRSRRERVFNIPRNIAQ